MASYAFTGLTGGNWSTGTNWTNMSLNTVGVAPTSSDDAYLNNKTVVIDAAISVNKISNKATTGFTVNASAGGSATVALNNSFYPTITIGSGGIEAVQATGTGNVISVSGTSTTTAAPYCFKIDCSGPITGGYSSASVPIYLGCTSTKIQINSGAITGGITSSDSAAIYSFGVGNTIYVNSSSDIIASTGPAIRHAVSTSTTIYVKASKIEGGSSVAAIRNEVNTSGVYIGYTYDFQTGTPSTTSAAVTNINASSSAPAIQSYTATAPYINTTPYLINATNVNGNTNGIAAIQSFNYKLISTATVKIPDLSATLQSFVVGGTSTSTAAEFWAYLTSNATTSGSLGKLIVDNLNAKVGDVKTATDRIPTNPASVQSTGDQIATLQ